jgi:NADH-quinone oxidoreductase subunit H
LPEAEAELVSGYNVEYSAIGFALFFLGEYASILFMSTLTVNLFLGGWDIPFIPFSFLNYIFYFIKLAFIIYLFIIIRAAIPRYRYDQLMYVG